MENDLDSLHAKMPLDVLCPLGSRRTSRELAVKLLVVNLTVMYAYGHLRTLRNDDSYISMAIFFVNPLLPAWELTASFVVLAVYALIHRRNVGRVKRAIGILYGKKPSADQLSNSTGEPIEYITWPPRLNKRFMFRMFALLTLLVQCVFSLWLYVRRVERNAAMTYDFRILLLALGGVCVVVLNVLHLLLDPKQPVLSGHEQGWKWLRPEQNNNYNVSGYTYEVPHCAVVSSIIGVPLAVYSGGGSSDSPLFYLQAASSIFAYPVTYVGILCAFLMPALMAALTRKGETNTQPWSVSLEKISSFTQHAGAVMFFVGFLIICSLGWVDYLIVFTKLATSELEALPTQVPCPQAWRDPKSDYIWAFA